MHIYLYTYVHRYMYVELSTQVYIITDEIEATCAGVRAISCKSIFCRCWVSSSTTLSGAGLELSACLNRDLGHLYLAKVQVSNPMTCATRCLRCLSGLADGFDLLKQCIHYTGYLHIYIYTYIGTQTHSHSDQPRSFGWNPAGSPERVAAPPPPAEIVN